MLIITGPTATGKTQIAVQYANQYNGAVISADSRQVYRGMDIGTGKDLNEYIVDGKQIAKYLIDIAEPGTEYNLFQFRKDFLEAYNTILQENKLPILCGGTGMYIESIVKRYNLVEVPENIALREELNNKTVDELSKILSSYKILHNKTDIDSRDRLLRAIEIEIFNKENPNANDFPVINNVIIGVNYEREAVRNRITIRLKERLENGMIEEVETLINKGVSIEKLIFYGLEYKYVAMYLSKQLSYKDMQNLLNIAIHQFAKRQMTWFRRMEKQGITIHWIDGSISMSEKLELIHTIYSTESAK